MSAGMRACSSARLLGVSADRVTLLAFMLSGALAGAAGVLISLHYGAITPYIGVEIGLKAIAVLGMGGSGISGELCRSVLAPLAPVPVATIRDYDLPAWVGQYWSAHHHRFQPCIRHG